MSVTTTNTTSKHTMVLNAALLSLIAGSAAVANEYGYFADENDQRWGRTQFPDFDQKREAIFATPGLPNNGEMYCVPASTMNAFAYLARHGYPGVEPGSANWTPGNPVQYDDITLHLQQLGQDMGISPTGGTNTEGWWDATRDWLPVGDFDLYQRFAISNHDTTTREIADIGRAGGIMSVCYGRWTLAGSTIMQRQSGHCITPTEVSAMSVNDSDLVYRDPATSDDESRFVQSNFAYRELDVSDATYTFQGQDYTFSRLEFGVNDGLVRLLDKIYVIFPKSGLTNWPAGNMTLLSPNPSDPENPITSVLAAPQGDEIIGCELAPSRTYVAAIARSGTGLHHFIRIDTNPPPTEDGTESIDPVDPDAKLIFCRRGYVNLVTGNELRQYDLNGDSTASPLVGSIPLPTDASGAPLCDVLEIAYDDENDKILLLCESQMLIVNHDLQGAVETRPIPVADSGEAHLDYLTISMNNLVISRASSSGAGHYTQVIWANTEYVPVATHTLPIGQTFTGLSADDAGTIWGVIDGTVAAFRPDGAGGFEPVADAAFVGQPAGSVFQISRSRTNYDERVHGQPGWNTNTPTADLALAPEIEDCGADFNRDGIGDVTDLLDFLVAWFAGDAIADLNADTVVDVTDLLDFLVAWFNGC